MSLKEIEIINEHIAECSHIRDNGTPAEKEALEQKMVDLYSKKIEGISNGLDLWSWVDYKKPNYVKDINLIIEKLRLYKASLEDKQQQSPNQPQSITYNINASNGSNVNTGTMNNSSMTAENIVKNLEKYIEENGGADKEELKNILEDTKELCSDIKPGSTLPTRKRLFEKLSNHMAKHGWFYGAIVQLIGTTAMQVMMQG